MASDADGCTAKRDSEDASDASTTVRTVGKESFVMDSGDTRHEERSHGQFMRHIDDDRIDLNDEHRQKKIAYMRLYQRQTSSEGQHHQPDVGLSGYTSSLMLQSLFLCLRAQRRRGGGLRSGF